MPASRTARVLWLTKGLGRGGAERLIVDVALRLDRSRFAVEVAYVLPHKDHLVGELVDGGLPVHCLGSTARTLDARWLLRLRGLMTDIPFDLVNTHAPVPAVAARLAADRSRTALVHTEHNVWPRYRMPTRVMNAATFHRNDLVIAVSQAVADSIHPPRPSSSPPVEVVVHGASLGGAPDGTVPRDASAARRSGRARLGLGSDDFVIGTVGHLTAKKNHRLLLDAFHDVAAARPAARLVMIGAGPLADDVGAHAARLGVSDRVTFTGVRDDVPALLPAFDLFVLSSDHEGLPIALLEAMASGVACVATAVGGIPEVIESGVDGVLVPARDRRRLAAAIGHLAADEDERAALAAAGRIRAADFDIGAASERIGQLFEKVLASR